MSIQRFNDSTIHLTKTFSGKKVLVTGHTGFKGSWLCEWLLAMGAEVTGFSLEPSTEPSLFKQLKLAERVTHVIGDIRDLEAVKKVVGETRPDFVFHLAAQPLVRLSYVEPVETYAVNVMGTVNVLEALRALQEQSNRGIVESLNRKDNGKNSNPEIDSTVQLFNDSTHHCIAVMITTDKCYENREWVHAYREEDPMGGYDPYSSSKGAAELVIASYRRSFFQQPTTSNEQPKIFVASARAGNVIGGGDWALDRIVPDCIRALERGEAIPVRNKTATRPWQHVLEPLGGYLCLAARLAASAEKLNRGIVEPLNRGVGKEASNSEIDSPIQRFNQSTTEQLCSAFNFGPELASNRTVAELVAEVLKHIPGKSEDRSDPKAPHEAGKLNLTTDKAFHYLGWRPVWNFEQTLEKTVAWYIAAKTADIGDLTRSQISAYCEDAGKRS